jgi:hypothetical protein
LPQRLAENQQTLFSFKRSQAQGLSSGLIASSIHVLLSQRFELPTAQETHSKKGSKGTYAK